MRPARGVTRTSVAVDAPGARGIQIVKAGALANAALAAVKLVAGVVGHSGALVADAAESTADVVGSLLVWGGLRLATRPADADHPYGHGKAEALAGAAVSLMLLGAAVGIALEAVRQIRTPHEFPAPWTLGVLVGVLLVKGWFARRAHAVGADLGSTAVKADAGHHRSDAITSGAAFVGIGVALVGQRVLHGGIGWAAADDWAALLAAGAIAVNGVTLLRPALDDLMDRTPGDDVLAPMRCAAAALPGVRAVEMLHARKVGLGFRVTVHVHADPLLPLVEAHALGGRVKAAILQAVPTVASVLVHMEPDPRDSAYPPMPSQSDT